MVTLTDEDWTHAEQVHEGSWGEAERYAAMDLDSLASEHDVHTIAVGITDPSPGLLLNISSPLPHLSMLIWTRGMNALRILFYGLARSRLPIWRSRLHDRP